MVEAGSPHSGEYMLETIGDKVLVRDHAIGARPEHELLLWCSRTSVDPQTAGRIRNLVGEEIDWQYLSRKASQHGVMPLLWQSFSTICPEAVPRATLDQLRLD